MLLKPLTSPSRKELNLLPNAVAHVASQIHDFFSRLDYKERYDALTGVLNRAAFVQILQTTISQYNRAISASADSVSANSAPADCSSPRFAVLSLDLDFFNIVNNSLGHHVGDQLLVEVARRLRSCLTNSYRASNYRGSNYRTDSSYSLARFGEDEFIILLNSIQNISDVTQIADRILEEMQRPFSLDGQDIFVSTSIGIAMGTANYREPAPLLQDANIALHRAKANGRRGYEVFSSTMRVAITERLQLETQLRHAIENHEFEVYYQPITHIGTEKITGFEALVRWQHPTLGMILPAQFIPVAEETGLIKSLGWWVMQQACQQMRIWQKQFSDCQTMVMSVNLSSLQFSQFDLLDRLEQVLWETGLPPRNLKLEITETVIMSQDESTRTKLSQLQDFGIQLSIDDFGTGYSSLGYLHSFPVSTLKIDRSFVSRLEANGKNSGIVRAIVALAHELDMDVVAEGVETTEQLEQLRFLGCENGQGYLFLPPVSALEMTQRLGVGIPTAA